MRARILKTADVYKIYFIILGLVFYMHYIYINIFVLGTSFLFRIRVCVACYRARYTSFWHSSSKVISSATTACLTMNSKVQGSNPPCCKLTFFSENFAIKFICTSVYIYVYISYRNNIFHVIFENISLNKNMRINKHKISKR